MLNKILRYCGIIVFVFGSLASGRAVFGQVEESGSETPGSMSEEASESGAPIGAENSTEEPTPPAIADLSPEQLEAAIEKVQSQLVQAQIESPSTSPSPPEVITALKDLENAIQRRITSNKRLTETRTTLEALKSPPEDNESNGEGDSTKVSTFLDLEQLRDKLETMKREAETDALAIGTAESLLSQASARVQRVEEHLREAKDGLITNGSSQATQVEVAELNVQQAKHEQANAEVQFEIAKLENEISTRRVSNTEAQIAEAQGTVFLTRNELEEKLSELDSRQEKASRDLQDLERTDVANQRRVEEAFEQWKSANTDNLPVLTEALEAQKAWALASSRGIELMQQRIDNIAKSRTLWERRYLVVRGAEAMELANWETEIRKLIEETAKRRTDIERRLQDLRTFLLEQENRLNSLENDATLKTEIESRIRATKRREEHLGNYLSGLLELDKLSARLLNDIQRERSIDSWQTTMTKIQITGTALWNKELFVIDEQAFRLGALIRSGILFAFCLIVTIAIRRVLRRTLIAQLRHRGAGTEASINDALLAIARKTRPTIVFLLALYVALRTLPLSDRLDNWLDSAALLLVLFQIATWAVVALQNSIDRAVRRRSSEDPSSVSAYGVLAFFGRVAIWSIVLLIFLNNLEGVEITALLAGLGVGGVAIAFALQNILGDIFCSIAILMDKPFVVGDFIIVGDMLGAVEQIGIKTTRIRSLGGEQIVFSNADLLSSRIRNYKRMYERRVLFNLGIVYESTEENIREVPLLIQNIIEDIPNTRFDRAHFQGYGDFALLYEVVYYVLGPDYNQYMDIQQEINLKILRAFKERGISFAYPTRELIVRGYPQDGERK